MALGEFTKQIAQQALLNATSKEPAPAPPPDSPSGVMLAQLNAMQKALKEDEELLVTYQNGPERLRVMEAFAPSPYVIVLTGPDHDRALTRAICGVESLHLICKVIKTPPGAKPVRLALVAKKG